MESLQPKEQDRLHVSGEQSEELRLNEDERLLLTLNLLFSVKSIDEYLEKENTVNMPLLRSFREHSNRVEKQNKLETE